MTKNRNRLIFSEKNKSHLPFSTKKFNFWNQNLFSVFFFFIEFLLGENVLIAPVVVQNATSRHVYLPGGFWRDENKPDSPLIKGRTWLYDFPAKIDVLPWFTRVNPTPQSLNSIGRVLPTGYILALCLIHYLFFWFNVK